MTPNSKAVEEYPSRKWYATTASLAYAATKRAAPKPAGAARHQTWPAAPKIGPPTTAHSDHNMTYVMETPNPRKSAVT